MSSKTIYEQLLAIADRNPKLLVSYKTDLTIHDYNILGKTQAGDRLVWMLRECGTELQYLPECFSRSHYDVADEITEEDKQKCLNWNYNWFSATAEGQRERTNSPLFFEITCTSTNAGKIKQITEAEAIALLEPKALADNISGKA